MIVIVAGNDGGDVQLVSEDGMRLIAPPGVLEAAGFRHLRTGQRLVVSVDDIGQIVDVRLP